MAVRPDFTSRLHNLINHFEKLGFGPDSVVVQMMNDFPRWTQDELAFTAAALGRPLPRIEALYLKSYRIIRETRLEEQKHVHILRERNSGRSFIPEHEGQAYDAPKNKNPYGSAPPPPQAAPPPPYWESPHGPGAGSSTGSSGAGPQFDHEYMRNFFKGFAGQFDWGHEHEQMQKEFEEALKKKAAEERTKRSNQSRGDSHKSAFERAAEQAKQGNPQARQGFNTKKPWSDAPSYLHYHFEVMEMAYPISMDDAKAQYRKMAMKLHPDNKETGSTDKFNKMKNSWDQIKEFLERE